MSGSEAVAYGLIDRVVDRRELVAAAKGGDGASGGNGANGGGQG
jgi:hypothetical protein